jgi:hypothetical protein
MDILILDSAYKHGITEANISYCLSHFNNDIMLNYPPMKRLFIGFDNLGRALEIIAIEDDEEDRLVVIHAMKLTKQYNFLLEGAEHEL